MKRILLIFFLASIVSLRGFAQETELEQLASYENSDGGGKSWFQLWGNDSSFEFRLTTREHRTSISRKATISFEWTRWPDFRDSILNGERRVSSGRTGRLPATEFPTRVKVLTSNENALSVIAFYIPQYTSGISLVLHPLQKEPITFEHPNLRLESLGDPEFINLLLAGERAYVHFLQRSEN